jgi:hypothetical protein
MISRRTLVIYNFGLAVLFLLVGLIGIYALESVSRPVALPPFDQASQVAIGEEKDMERLRSRALFYFELARDLKRARYSDQDANFGAFRTVFFVAAIIFAIGGLMTLGVRASSRA